MSILICDIGGMLARSKRRQGARRVPVSGPAGAAGRRRGGSRRRSLRARRARPADRAATPWRRHRGTPSPRRPLPGPAPCLASAPAAAARLVRGSRFGLRGAPPPSGTRPAAPRSRSSWPWPRGTTSARQRLGAGSLGGNEQLSRPRR